MSRILPLVMGVCLLAPLALANVNALTHAPDEVFVVRFDALPADVHEGASFAGGRVIAVDDVLDFAVVRAPARTVHASAASADVVSVESDADVELLDAPNDPLYAEQYGPSQVHAASAWALAQGSTDTSICVVDTGVRYTHEDLAGARWLGGKDFVNGDDDPMDDHGHGTHVAGTAAATTGNGKGVAGIAQVGLMAAKVMDENGRGSASDVAAGIAWCADEGADVVTLSLGSSTPTRVLKDAVQYASARDVIVVAAAGNSGPCDDCVSFPAAFEEVIAVTCTDAREASCSFSSTGAEAEIAAPGHGILAPWHTADDAYKAISGTSMSAPHVAGVTALVKSLKPGLSNAEVRNVLRASAKDLGAEGRDVDFGFGLVDARAALDAATGDAPNAVKPEPTPQPNPMPEPDANRAPVAHAGRDVTVSDADGDDVVTVDLNGRWSTDPDGTITSYAWRYGGDLIADTPTATVTLDVRAVMLVALVVTDDKGKSDADLVRVIVESPRAPSDDHADDRPSDGDAWGNDAPDARVDVACDGARCAFDASGSTDPNGDDVAFEWSFGIGDGEATGPRVTHTFEDAGKHRVTVKVTDPHGRSDWETVWVRVG